MKPQKSLILYYFLKLKWSRIFSSNKVKASRKRKWKNKLEHSPFYRNYLGTKQEFPVMNKSIFMKNFNLINTVKITKEEALNLAVKSETSRDFAPNIKGISVGLSSGTSGNKGIFLTSPKEKAIWVAAILDRVIGFSFTKRKVAFFLRANNNLYESVKSTLLSFTFYDIKTPIEKQIESLKKLEADILVAQPSIILEIARQFQKKDIRPTFNKIISVAEVLEADQKRYFEQVFKCPIDQVYQCTEGFLAYTCKKGRLHFNEDWLTIEKKYIDKDLTRFHPVITDYLRESQPIVRYELNDIIQEAPRCTCGSKSTVIKKIEGRSDDVFKFGVENETVLIYPDFIRRTIVLASENVTNYVVTLKSANLISVYLEVNDYANFEPTFKQVKEGLTKMLSTSGLENIDIVSADLNHESINKFTRIKNEYSKSI